MVIDLVAGLLVAIGFYQGFTKGLINTVFATLSVLIAVVAALKLSPIVIGFLQGIFSFNPAILFVLGFILTFIGTMALVRFVGKKLDKLSKDLNISGVNKLLGGALLGLFYALLISIGLHFMNKIDLLSQSQKDQSFSYAYLEPLPRISAGIGESLKPAFQEFWNALLETMDTIKEKGESMNK